MLRSIEMAAESGSNRHRFGVLQRVALVILEFAALGLPVTDLPGFGLLFVAALLAVYGRPVRLAWRWAVAVVLTIATATLPSLMPTPRIEEGHNAFVVTGPGQALEAALPRDVFIHMLDEFDQVHPPAQRCDPAIGGCWRGSGVPDRPFALSADGLLQHPRYSRVVSTIDLGDPIWARLGFINERRYTWYVWVSDIVRFERDGRVLALLHRWQLRIPYFVMYELPASLVGSRLCWHGDLLWQRADGGYDVLRRETRDCRELTAADAGRRVFGVAIRPDLPLSIHLDPAPGVAFWNAAASTVRLAGAAGLLLLLVQCPWRRLVWPGILVLSSVAVLLLVDASFLGGFRPLIGGDDGLVHEGFARIMLSHLLEGDISQILLGDESVYYFMPGLRYFHFIERILFGDTNFGYLIVMLALPLLVWRLFLVFLPLRWGVVLSLLFVITPIGVLFGSTYFLFLKDATHGDADPLGLTLFLGGLLLIIEQVCSDRSRSVGAAALAGFVLALALIVRPNLGISIGVLLVGASIYVLRRWSFGQLAALALGFTPVLLLPLHNWVYGGVFVPLTSSANHPVNLVLPPETYVSAFTELLRLELGGSSLAAVFGHWGSWLSGLSHVWLFVPLHVAALAIVVMVVLSGRQFDFRIRLVAIATLAQQVIFIFWVYRNRHALLAWLLMLLVDLVWLRQCGLPYLERYSPRLVWWLAERRVIARFGPAVGWLERCAGR